MKLSGIVVSSFLVLISLPVWSIQKYRVVDLGLGEAHQIISEKRIGGSGFFWSPETGRVETGLDRVYLNKSGAVAGHYVPTDPYGMPAIWTEEGGIQDLGEEGYHGFVYGIGEDGTVIGFYGKVLPRETSAFRWIPDGTIEIIENRLPIFQSIFSGAVDIDSTGRILIDARHQGSFIWDPEEDTLIDIGIGGAWQFNDLGEVIIGNSVWSSTSGATTIPNIFGHPDREFKEFLGQGINNQGHVVGLASSGKDSRFYGVLWNRLEPVALLDDLLGSESKDMWSIDRANDIDEMGNIVGSAFASDGRHAVLLVPLVETELWQLTLGIKNERGGDVTGFGLYNDLTEVTIIAEADEGFRFVKWLEGEETFSTEQSTTIVMTEPRELVACFEGIWNVDVTVQPEAGGTVSGSGIYGSNEAANLIAIPNDGYRFVKWIVGESDSTINSGQNIFIVVNEDLTITALFEEITWIISTSADNGLIRITPDSDFYSQGTITELMAFPNLGYMFDHWEGVASGTENPIEILMNADKSITAIFSKDLSDKDHDGLSAFDELVTYGTDPESDDSDGDNIKDGDEIGTTFDPNVDDTSALQVIAENPETYLDLVSTTEGIHPEILISKSDNGDFIVKVQIEATENLRDWVALDLSGAVIEGDTMTLVIPASESAEFLRILGSKSSP